MIATVNGRIFFKFFVESSLTRKETSYPDSGIEMELSVGGSSSLTSEDHYPEANDSGFSRFPSNLQVGG